MGSRGAGSGRRGGTFANETEFEKSLKGFDDPRLKDYQQGMDDITDTYGNPKSLITNAKNNGLSEWTAKSLETDKKNLQARMKDMPEKKTPKQLGEIAGIQEYIKAIDEALKYRGKKGKNPADNVDILI